MVNLTEHARGNLGGIPASIVATPCIHGLCGFFLQGAHEDDKPSKIYDYVNPTLAEFRSIHDPTYGTYLAVSMLLSIDRSIYGKLIDYLSNSYLMGIYQYPQTCSKMHNTIVHWRNHATCYILHAPPGDMVFVQHNDDDLAKGKTQSNNVQR